jgi:uncharacterized membrane protein
MTRVSCALHLVSLLRYNAMNASGSVNAVDRCNASKHMLLYDVSPLHIAVIRLNRRKWECIEFDVAGAHIYRCNDTLVKRQTW